MHLFQMSVPKAHWSDVILAACYLINHMPTMRCLLINPYSIYLLTFLGVFALLSTPKILELSDTVHF